MCAHPQCEAIEAALLRFESAAQIAAAHGIADRRSIYRHAHALGLFVRRNRAFGCSLEVLLENAARFEPSFDDVILATEKLSKISEDGESRRPPKPPDIYCPVPASALEELGFNLDNLPIALAAEAACPPVSWRANRHNSRLKTAVSHSKQTTETLSNRHKNPFFGSRTNSRDGFSGSPVLGVRPVVSGAEPWTPPESRDPTRTNSRDKGAQGPEFKTRQARTDRVSVPREEGVQ